MSQNIRGNNAHLTLSDRIFIEQELNQRSTFYSIAKVLHKDPTTISKEVKRSRTLSQAFPFWDKSSFAGIINNVENVMSVATDSTDVKKLVATATMLIPQNIIYTLSPTTVIARINGPLTPSPWSITSPKSTPH